VAGEVADGEPLAGQDRPHRRGQARRYVERPVAEQDLQPVPPLAQAAAGAGPPPNHRVVADPFQPEELLELPGEDLSRAVEIEPGEES